MMLAQKERWWFIIFKEAIKFGKFQTVLDNFLFFIYIARGDIFFEAIHLTIPFDLSISIGYSIDLNECYVRVWANEWHNQTSSYTHRPVFYLLFHPNRI